MNVLSLCDGMSCGYMALERAGIKIDKYYASEIKPIAIQNSMSNFPKIIHIGDVTKVKYKNGWLFTECGAYHEYFDLVIFGSPCQSFSRAMIKEKRIGIDDPVRSGIFLECFRVLCEVNPEYFLMENVVMDSESMSVITEALETEPTRLNSSLVSAQMRDRLYWTNIKFNKNITDKNILLNDIITGYTPKNKAYCLLANDSHGYYNGANRHMPSVFHRFYNKSLCNIIFESKEQYTACVELNKKILNGRKPSAEYYKNIDDPIFNGIRFLTKYERAKLQTIEPKYVENLSEFEAANLLGDGWTVDIITNIFKGL